MRPKVIKQQQNDKTNSTDSDAVSEEMHGSRTSSLHGYAHLQGNTTLQQPTSTSRATELKKYRALLPTKSLMENAHRKIVREQMVDDRKISTEHYNKPAKYLQHLSIKQKVYVPVNNKQNQWTLATITQTSTATQSRSYTVETKN